MCGYKTKRKNQKSKDEHINSVCGGFCRVNSNSWLSFLTQPKLSPHNHVKGCRMEYNSDPYCTLFRKAEWFTCAHSEFLIVISITRRTGNASLAIFCEVHSRILCTTLRERGALGINIITEVGIWKGGPREVPIFNALGRPAYPEFQTPSKKWQMAAGG